VTIKSPLSTRSKSFPCRGHAVRLQDEPEDVMNLYMRYITSYGEDVTTQYMYSLRERHRNYHHGRSAHDRHHTKRRSNSVEATQPDHELGKSQYSYVGGWIAICYGVR